MQITKKFIVVGAGVVALVAGGGAAFAATSSSAAPAPKVTAEQAIQTAQKQVPGAWVDELDHDSRGKQADTWELELVKGAERHEVDVDAATGKVTKHETEQADNDDDGSDD
ncbi:hypothetical protein GCM10022419_094710 [Nonomuraea rosea]|uniref:PepSY domain-containing protein n=1 Tax=Nonomuraea rosea TaxID=638574 RepID=A0ABP6Z7C9_9ACTN